jgi:hypothetical protein
MVLRVTRVATDVLGTASADLRITRSAVDVFGTPTVPSLRLHRFALQALIAVLPPSDLCVTRVGLDVFGTASADLRITRTSLDVFGEPAAPSLQVHRYALQALIAVLPPSDLRVTRVVFDVFGTADTDLRITRTSLDIFGTPAVPSLQVHRFAVQALVEKLPHGPLYITRSVVDVFGTSTDPSLQVHRFAVQILVEKAVSPFVIKERQSRKTIRRTMRQLPRRRV